MWRSLYGTLLAVGGVVGLGALSAHAEGLRIDLNQDNLRGDVRSPAMENWSVVAGAVAEFRTSGLTFELRSLDANRPVETGWWKPGFDYPASMASDGILCSGTVRLTIQGLAPGKHSLGSWHALLDDRPAHKIRVVVPGGDEAYVVPTRQVKHDDDAAAAWVEFEVRKTEPVVIEFQPAAGGIVVLNGLELDYPDPTRRALTPTPFDIDEHAPENPLLRWRAAARAKSHRVYVGDDRARVASATLESPEFRGETAEAQFAAAPLKLSHQRPTFWRVDEVHSGGIERGAIWRFQVRRLAFPGAEGYGRFAIGGRGGRVIEVTNLNDDGPGSLRAAVEASGPRTVVFRVGGLIPLKSKLVVRNPYLTIAGETAPGDGICVKSYTFGCSDTHDVMFRHVRIRVGDESGTTQDGCGARGSDHVIFDHCSISWSIDEGFSSRQGRNLTVQRCLIAEALNIAGHEKYAAGKGHSFAGSISGDIGSFHHNLLAHCTGRNWSLAGGLDRTAQRLAGRLDIRNNVVYNWRDRTTDGGVRELCFVNNLYLPGPVTKVFTLLKPDPGDAGRGMRAFLAGNEIEGHTDVNADNWTAFNGTGEDLARIRAESPLWESHIRQHAVSELLENVLADVGATKPKRDAVDTRIIADVRARQATFTGGRGKLPGIIDTQADAGGWPEYQSGKAPPDDDHDGLPNAWETARGLNPADPKDGAAYAADGYTHLEHYLHELLAP